ncbi:hypothetical protein BDD12DRAFT_874058 [Trichophaea hybrida]|nr:hypothetical protein BDD12DRAFT_874058 [Trichophaea hybrida]
MELVLPSPSLSPHPLPLSWPFTLLTAHRRVSPPRVLPTSQSDPNGSPPDPSYPSIPSPKRPLSRSSTRSRASVQTITTTTPELHVKLSLPRARYEKSSAPGLRLKLTAKLAPHIDQPVSFHRRGTIFDDLCPLLGRGGFWGIADAARRPMRSVGANAGEAEGIRRVCTRVHDGEEGFLEFGDNFVTLYPGQDLVCEKLLLAKDLEALVVGESYTVYSRPDREKKRPAKVPRCKWGTREELAESTFWCGDESGGEGTGWTKVDVNHIVRDRDWIEMVVLVGNSSGFMWCKMDVT